MSGLNKIISRDGFNTSIWQTAGNLDINEKEIDTSTLFDVVIVGAGITGVSTALMLQKAGKKCLLIESNTVGFGTTGGTSAHLNTFFDATYPEISTDFGEDEAKLAADSGKEAFSIIAGFIDEYNIDCDFEYKDGYLYSETEKETKQLKEILQASLNAGIAVEISDKNGVSIPFDMAIRFAKQGQFHPIKYVNHLAKTFVDLGGILLEKTFVDGYSNKDEIIEISAASMAIHTLNLVYATHLPPGITSYSLRCAPYRSYVLGIKLKDNSYPEDLVYDMQEPYHYFRTHQIDGQKYLIVGGEDHKTGHDDPEEAFANLESYVKEFYNIDSIVYRWSSQYYVPVDGLPYIGQPNNAENIYIATGFNGNGMMFGTLSAKLISDQILGIENRYSTLYSPSRLKPVAGFTEFVKENADVAWHFIADRFKTEELESTYRLKNGEGKVVELDGQKIALYKSDSGEVSAVSPVCTHTGCIVNFNPAEKSWDCPCHGGRFDIAGKVITGPPQKDLKQISLTN